jgi:hypothetical protein
MSFTERSMNFMGALLYRQYFLRLADNETSIFRDAVGADFPSLLQLARDKTELVFVNSVELLDYPRPIYHNIVYIGGVVTKCGCITISVGTSVCLACTRGLIS